MLDDTRVVLINLKRRQDRLDNFRRQQKEKGWCLPDPIIFEAIHGDTVSVPHMFHSGGGAWGCRSSWVSVLERAMMDEVPSLLVLEDDVCWKPTLEAQLTSFFAEVPSDWQVAFLGGQHISPPHPMSPTLSKCRNTQRTHAILIRGAEAMQSSYRLMVTANRHIDHLFGPHSGRELRSYAPDPFIFGQDASRSDISGNNDGSRYWSKPAPDLKLVFLDPATPKSVVEKVGALGIHFGNWRDDRGFDEGMNRVKESQHALKKVLDTLAWEVQSDQGKYVGVWHPDIPLDLIRQVWTSDIIETGGTVKEIVEKVPGLL